MDWDVAIARADLLSTRHKTAADLLFFYRAVVRFQKEIYHRVRAHPKADAQKLDTGMLAAFVDLQPAIGISVAVLFHMDVITPNLLAGAAVALAGVVLVQLRRPVPAVE